MAIALFTIALFPEGVQAQSSPIYPSGSVVKALDSGAVYYVGSDNKRYFFPSWAGFSSWYPDRVNVISVPTEKDLTSLPRARDTVTVRPGKTLVQFGTKPEIYAVDTGATIRWLKSPAVAEAIYGLNWQNRIIRLSEDHRAYYFRGLDIADPTTFSRAAITNRSVTINDELRARHIIRDGGTTRVAAAESNLPFLRDLKHNLNSGFTPSFSWAGTSYRLTANKDEDRILLTPTADNGMVITVNDTIVPTGTSIAINLPFGFTSIYIKVTRTATGENRTYSILVDRTVPNNNHRLASLSHNLRGTMTPRFHPDIEKYDLRAEYLETSITLSPTLSDTRAAMFVNGAKKGSGNSQTILLSPGENIIPILVRAENGAEKLYTITIYRNPLPGLNDTNLRSLEENLLADFVPGFDPNMTRYTILARENEETLTLTARPRHSSATVYINGEKTERRIIPLNLGETEIHVTVALDVDERKEYTITVRKDL